MRIRLPWGEELSIECDIERFSLDVMNMTAEYYIDCPDPTLVVVRSEDYKLEDDTIVVKSCKVTLTDAWEEDEDDDRIEQVWKDFMLFEDSHPAPPRTKERE